MSYSNLLKSTIENNNFTHNDIVRELKNKGINIDKSYLSKLINGKMPAPREEISRAIAQICNVDERILVIEGYYEKAPKEIQELLFYIQKTVMIAALYSFKNIQNIDSKELSILEESLKQQNIGEFLTTLLDYDKNDEFKISNNNLIMNSKKDNIQIQLQEPVSILISNNDMSPIVPENSKVIINVQNKYQSGDVVAIKYQSQILSRYYFENNGIVSFSAISKNALTVNTNDKDLKLLGKIVTVMYDI